jgi:hypothetical protein
MQSFLLYIDPGSGSLILQVLAGGALAAGMFIKNYWLQIKSFFKRGSDKTSQQP